MDDAVGESADETNDVKKGEALRQQRRHFVGIDGDECACGYGVVAPNGTTRQDCVDRQMLQARLCQPQLPSEGDAALRELRATLRSHLTRGPRTLTITLDWVVESIEHLTVSTRWAFKIIKAPVTRHLH